MSTAVKGKKIELDLTKGPLFKHLLVVAIPLVFTTLLTVLFHTADTFIVGIFVDGTAVAAVGACSSIVTLLIGLFLGLASGTNVVLAKAIGNQDQLKSKRIIGMSMVISVAIGVLLLFVGLIFARPLLVLMDTDPEVIDLAVKYFKWYMAGMPVLILYNFCSAIMRAAGDTKRPLIYISIGGVLNIILNIVSITVFGMDVEGVAIATVISQAVASYLCIRALFRAEGNVKLEKEYLKFYWNEFKEILHIGLPSGLQTCLFALSNVLIQSAINGFGEYAMAGNAYAVQLESFLFNTSNSIAIANMTIVSQNYGAGNIKRIKKTIINTTLFMTGLSLAISLSMLALANPLLVQLTKNDANSAVIIDYAMRRMKITFLLVFVSAYMDVFSLSLRAIGRSISSMIVCLAGICLTRIIWLETLFKVYKEFETIFYSYPVSWILTALVLAIFLIVALAKEQTQKDILE